MQDPLINVHVGIEVMAQTKDDKSAGWMTSIGIKRETKERLRRNRYRGQSYDGFMCELLDLWEDTKRREKTRLSR